MAKDLFPYQQEALRALGMAHEKHQRILLSLPTGTGKTFTAATYVKQTCIDLGKTVLWIAHSEELLSQAYSTFTDDLGLPDGMVARLFAKHREWSKEPDAKVWLMNNLVTKGPDEVDLIVIDEAHHAAGDSYKGWLSSYATFKSDGPRVLGLTATPYRLHEGQVTALEEFGFSKPRVPIFQTTAFKRSFCALAAQGYVAPFRHIKFETNLQYKMQLQQGEFSADSLKQLDNARRNRMIADYWRSRRADFGKTLIFAASKAHAKNLAKHFGDDGDYVISGDDERADVIAAFRTGKVPVLVNVGIFKEGVDVRDIRTVILARPTASPGLFTQMVGRGSRIAPGKGFFYLVDVHDQLGKYEGYLAGIEDLGDREPELIEIVERKACAREKLGALRTSGIADAASAMVDLLVTPDNEVLTRFGGWMTFRDADEATVPVATLLEHDEYRTMLGIADAKGEVHPRSLAEVVKARGKSHRLGKCAQALRDGLIGLLHELSERDVQELAALRTEGATSIGIAPGDDLHALKAFTDDLQTRGQKLGVAATVLGGIENDYVQGRQRFACVAWLRSGAEAYAKLLGHGTFAIIAGAVALNATGGLNFSDAPRLLSELEAAEPDLKAHARAILDGVAATKNLDDLLTLCPGVKRP